MNNIRLFAAIGLVALPLCSFAQKGVDVNDPKHPYGLGEDSARCVMNLVSYGDAFKAKNLVEAYNPWKVVFDEAPLAKGTTLYNDGVKIVKEMIKKNPAEKANYYKVLLSIYDQRAKYYGTNKNYPTSYIMGLKAIDMLAYQKDDKAARAEAVKLLDASLDADGVAIITSFVNKLIQQTADMYRDKEVDGEAVVNAYLRGSEALGKIEEAQKKRLENAKTKAAAESVLNSLPESREYLEGTFAASGAADCETLARIFTPMLAEHTSDADWLKKINKLLGDCTDSELYYSISESLHKIDPQASSARGLAKMYLKQKNIEQCVAYYREAIELETDDKLKGRYYHELARVQFADGKLSEAKSSALSAANLRSDWGEPYLLLAQIYAQGARTITGDKKWEKNAAFWAAYDKCVRAKNVDSSESVVKEANSLMGQYAQHFPAKEDLFFDGVKDGETYHVGGIINENTVVRAKK